MIDERDDDRLFALQKRLWTMDAMYIRRKCVYASMNDLLTICVCVYLWSVDEVPLDFRDSKIAFDRIRREAIVDQPNDRRRCLFSSTNGIGQNIPSHTNIYIRVFSS